MKNLILIGFSLLLCLNVMADDNDKNTCKHPVIPNTQASDVIVKLFNKRRDQYEKCIDKFVKEKQAISKSNPNTDVANAAHDAAEAAIKEYNAFMAQLKEHNEQVGEDSDKDK